MTSMAQTHIIFSSVLSECSGNSAVNWIQTTVDPCRWYRVCLCWNAAGNAFVLQQDVPSKGHDCCQRLAQVSALIPSLEIETFPPCNALPFEKLTVWEKDHQNKSFGLNLVFYSTQGLKLSVPLKHLPAFSIIPNTGLSCKGDLRAIGLAQQGLL